MASRELVCNRCAHRFVTEQTPAKCPACQSTSVHSPRAMLISGVVLTLVGLFLVGLIGAITWHLAPSLLAPGADVGGTRFSGSARFASLVLALFGALIAFGLWSFVIGVARVGTRRPINWMNYVMFALLAVVVALALVTLNTAPR